MELTAAVSAARSLLDLAKELAVLIKRALSTADLRQRVLLYLEAAHGAVWGLGMERQQILTDARRCEVQNTTQVEALWKRMDTYLHEDHIRPQLQDAIDGLRGCNASIAAQAQGFSWRKRDKQAAVETFTRTLSELERLLQGLTSNFYFTRSAAAWACKLSCRSTNCSRASATTTGVRLPWTTMLKEKSWAI